MEVGYGTSLLDKHLHSPKKDRVGSVVAAVVDLPKSLAKKGDHDTCARKETLIPI